MNSYIRQIVQPWLWLDRQVHSTVEHNEFKLKRPNKTKDQNQNTKKARDSRKDSKDRPGLTCITVVQDRRRKVGIAEMSRSRIFRFAK